MDYEYVRFQQNSVKQKFHKCVNSSSYPNAATAVCTTFFNKWRGSQTDLRWTAQITWTPRVFNNLKVTFYLLMSCR